VVVWVGFGRYCLNYFLRKNKNWWWFWWWFFENPKILGLCDTNWETNFGLIPLV
jgi:hypothetical protein